MSDRFSFPINAVQSFVLFLAALLGLLALNVSVAGAQAIRHDAEHYADVAKQLSMGRCADAEMINEDKSYEIDEE